MHIAWSSSKPRFIIFLTKTILRFNAFWMRISEVFINIFEPKRSHFWSHVLSTIPNVRFASNDDQNFRIWRLFWYSVKLRDQIRRPKEFSRKTFLKEPTLSSTERLKENPSNSLTRNLFEEVWRRKNLPNLLHKPPVQALLSTSCPSQPSEDE